MSADELDEEMLDVLVAGLFLRHDEIIRQVRLEKQGNIGVHVHLKNRERVYTIQTKEDGRMLLEMPRILTEP